MNDTRPPAAVAIYVGLLCGIVAALWFLGAEYGPVIAGRLP